MVRKFFLEKFRCDRDNDGDDSDSPYFLFFFGVPEVFGHPIIHFLGDVVPVYLENLDDTVASDGTWTRVHERTPHFNVEENMHVLVALLERDDGIDLTDEEFDRLRTHMTKKYSHFGNEDGLRGDALIKRLRKEFRRAINANTNNDDLIGIKHLPIPVSGQPAHLTFVDDPDDGSYTVAFLLEPA